MNTNPRVNYPLPLLATTAGTLVVIVMLAVLGFFAAANSWRQFTATSDDPGGAACLGVGCGLLAVAMIGAIPFLFGTVISALRDLNQPLQRMGGRLADKYTRRGSYWIAVRAGDAPPPAAGADPAPWAALSPPADDRSDPEPAPSLSAARPGAVVWQAPAPATDFGAGLAQAEQQVRRPSSDDPLAAPAADDLVAPHAFRVDKPVYEALLVGESVIVAYSRFLEHVYYVERADALDQPIVRNKTLI